MPFPSLVTKLCLFTIGFGVTKEAISKFPHWKTRLSGFHDNSSIMKDLDEILEWAETESTINGLVPELPFACSLELHGWYTISDILAKLGHASLGSAGQRGIGVLHLPTLKAYALLVTYQKTEREFSPSTMYADYPISRELLHWESQSNTTQESATGQNLISA